MTSPSRQATLGSPHPGDEHLAMRDLAQISGPLRRTAHSQPHARALRQRVVDLRARDTDVS
ncbi:MAG: hypothetical protein ACRDTH_17265 [Pseudonocardiaceae bacterium]